MLKDVKGFMQWELMGNVKGCVGIDVLGTNWKGKKMCRD
jgi:hypothetical protein